MGLLLAIFVIAAVVGVVMVIVAELREERRYNDWRRRHDADLHQRQQEWFNEHNDRENEK